MDSVGKNQDQVIRIENRRKVDINGVESILSMDEKYIAIMTNLGKIEIEGKELEVIDLSRESKSIIIKGSFNGIYYSDSEPKRAKGLFG